MNSTIQLSLYDLTPEPLLVRVPFVSSKHPWELSEEEYEVYEDTILYHNRPSVSGRDNPFQEFLTGQEADVFAALKAGETVPPEVLARFEELKEWHETGSSPIIRETEERLRERQEEIANRLAIGTEEIHQEEDRELVGGAREADAQKPRAEEGQDRQHHPAAGCSSYRLSLR